MDRNDIGTRTTIAQRSSQAQLLGSDPPYFTSPMRSASPTLFLVIATGANCVTCSVGFSPSRRNATSMSNARRSDHPVSAQWCGQVAGLYLSERLRKRVKADERHFTGKSPALESHQRPTPHRHWRRRSRWGRLHPRQRRFRHRQALGAIEVGRVFEDELVFVASLIQHIMEAVAALESRARAGLAL
jgi:hypothetical protein